MTTQSVLFSIVGLIGFSLAQVTVPPPGSPFGPRPIYPLPPPGVFVPILQQHYDLNPDGSYSFGFQSADGTSRKQDATVRFPGAPVAPGFPAQGGDLAVVGNFAYVSPEGAPIEVSYFADENGYQPTGPHIHPAIQKAVAYQVAKARAENAGGPIPLPAGSPTPFPPSFQTPYPLPYSTPFIPRPTRDIKKA